ncbi:MAG: YraN family protein [Clostridiales bacterium]|nr:YraN family protein [Clostridiales bacterium]MBQ3107334.1 YraN family protein [Bacillota bacterium]
MEQTQMLGKRGEDLAADYLQRKGYRILARNFRCRRGELDIVAEKGGVLVFAEVKTRRSLAFGLPGEAVTPKKQIHLLQGAAYYCRTQGIRGMPLRMDVVEVLFLEEKPYLHHIENAFS